MLTWREVERTHLYAGLAVELLDALDGRPPRGRYQLALERDDGGWRPTDRRPRWIRPGLAFYPYLERYRDAAGRPARNYRVSVVADPAAGPDDTQLLYAPLYRWQEQPGVEVTVSPWDDATPPAVIPSRPVRVPLLPRPGRLFETSLVLRGYVINPGGAPVISALVEFDNIKVLTEPTGEFALPMPRAPTGLSLVDVAAVPSDGRADVFPVTLPDALTKKVVFTLT